MKLFFKITAFILIVIFVIISINTFVSVNDEIRLFEQKTIERNILVGHVLKDMVEEGSIINDQEYILHLIEQINKRNHNTFIRWVWLKNDIADYFQPFIPIEEFKNILKNTPVSIKKIVNRELYINTYIPFIINPSLIGGIEVSESVEKQNNYIYSTIVRELILAFIMISMSLIIIWFIGTKVIKKPLMYLIERTRHISSGDLSRKIELKGNDELADLEKAFNDLCLQLETSRDNLIIETEKRINTVEQLRHSERLATLGRLSSGIAHELGTPINVIEERAKSIFKKETNGSKTGEYARIIIEQSERMSTIIRQLLDFSRKKKMNFISVDLIGLIANVKNFLEPALKKSKIDINITNQNELPLIYIDSSQIQQVFINLITNSIAAIGDKSGIIEIKLERKKNDEKDDLLIIITDNGMGVTKENLNKLFEPFFTTKESGKGTGLGLSIVYNIIQDHDGKIEAASEPGRGTSFFITLPVRREPNL